MSAIDYTEFDAAITAFKEAIEKEGGLDAMPEPRFMERTGHWFNMVLGRESTSVPAKQAAIALWQSFQVMDKSRMLAPSQAVLDRYAAASRDFTVAFNVARQRAWATTGPKYYVFGAELRNAATALKDAVERVRNNAAAMATLADALSGATFVISMVA